LQKVKIANQFVVESVEGTQTRWWERSWVIPAGLALLAFLLYANTIDGHFFYSWDDNRYVTENTLMRDISPQGIYNMFSQFYFAAYIPVTILSYAVDYAIWGMNPIGYHLQNIILNAANAALVYIFLKRLLDNRGVALIAALLFTVHPLQVESVAWVAERKNLLSLFFMLLSFLSHMRSARDDAPAWALPMSWFLFMLSVLTKPVVVGAPLLFMAYDYYWAHMPLKRVILRSIAPWIIGIAGAALIMIAHKDYGGIKEHRGGSLLGTAQVMLVVFWDYVVSFINPRTSTTAIITQFRLSKPKLIRSGLARRYWYSWAYSRGFSRSASRSHATPLYGLACLWLRWSISCPLLSNAQTAICTTQASSFSRWSASFS
jgi:hypothetical protein